MVKATTNILESRVEVFITSKDETEITKNYPCNLPNGTYRFVRCVLNSGSLEQLKLIYKDNKQVEIKTSESMPDICEYLFEFTIEYGTDFSIDVFPNVDIALFFFKKQ